MYDYIVTATMNNASWPLIKVFDSDYEAYSFEAELTTDLIEKGFIYHKMIKLDDIGDSTKFIYTNPNTNQDISLVVNHTRKFNLSKLFKKVKRWIKKE